jgi:hypothetical protein
MKPAKHQYTILKQICQHIPAHLVAKLARSFGVGKKARSFFALVTYYCHAACPDRTQPLT